MSFFSHDITSCKEISSLVKYVFGKKKFPDAFLFVLQITGCIDHMGCSKSQVIFQYAKVHSTALNEFIPMSEIRRKTRLIS